MANERFRSCRLHRAGRAWSGAGAGAVLIRCGSSSPCDLVGGLCGRPPSLISFIVPVGLRDGCRFVRLAARSSALVRSLTASPARPASASPWPPCAPACASGWGHRLRRLPPLAPKRRPVRAPALRALVRCLVVLVIRPTTRARSRSTGSSLTRAARRDAANMANLQISVGCTPCIVSAAVEVARARGFSVCLRAFAFVIRQGLTNDAPGMRCRLSPTADVPSHTSGAAMCQSGHARIRSPRRLAMDQTSATALAAIVKSYAHLNRSRIDLPITQSLSSSDRNDSSSVKWVMRCL